MPPPQHTKKRLTSTAMQDVRAANKANKVHKSKAYKHATTWYASEKGKKGGLSAAKIAEKVKAQFGCVGPDARTILRYYKDDLVGQSPKKKGPEGNVPDTVFKLLCEAWESCVRIQQINGRANENTRKRLAGKVNAVLRGDETVLDMNVLNRILIETALDLKATQLSVVEERRIRWTTYRNLKVWFANWKIDLEELGFAERDENGNVLIPTEQLQRIVNIDETCLSLDGSQCNRGGRPEVTFYDPRFPHLGKGTSKSALTTTPVATQVGRPSLPIFNFKRVQNLQKL